MLSFLVLVLCGFIICKIKKATKVRFAINERYLLCHMMISISALLKSKCKHKVMSLFLSKFNSSKLPKQTLFRQILFNPIDFLIDRFHLDNILKLPWLRWQLQWLAPLVIIFRWRATWSFNSGFREHYYNINKTMKY